MAALHIVRRLIHGPLTAFQALLSHGLRLFPEEGGKLIRSELSTFRKNGLVLIAELVPEGGTGDKQPPE